MDPRPRAKFNAFRNRHIRQKVGRTFPSGERTLRRRSVPRQRELPRWDRRPAPRTDVQGECSKPLFNARDPEVVWRVLRAGEQLAPYKAAADIAMHCVEGVPVHFGSLVVGT